MSESRVFWNAEEKRIIAAESYRLISKDTSLNKLEAIARAQTRRLPQNRQRPMDKVRFEKFSPWIEPMWKELAAKKKAEAKKAAHDLFTESPAQQPVEEKLETRAAQLLEEYHQPETLPQALPETLPETPPPAPPAPEEPRHMVRWVESEKLTIAKGVARRMRQQEMERLEALRTTISLDLPDYRRREISTWSQVEAWIEPLLKQAHHELVLEEIHAREERERAEREERARIEAEKLEAQRVAEEAREREQEIERRVAARVNALSFDALIRAFARKLARDTLTAIQEEMHSGLSDTVLDVMTAPSAPAETGLPKMPPQQFEYNKPVDAPKLPKIMVVGLWPKQEQDVKQAFLGTFDLVFVPNSKEGGQGAGGNGMMAKADGCEFVIGMTDSMGLDVQQKKKHLRRPFVALPGSASALKRWLSAYQEGHRELPSVGGDDE